MTLRGEESFHMVLPMTGRFQESPVTLAILTPCLDVSMHCYPLSPGSVVACGPPIWVDLPCLCLAPGHPTR